MDHDDDLAAFGLREVDEDRAAGEYADAPALARDAAGEDDAVVGQAVAWLRDYPELVDRRDAAILADQLEAVWAAVAPVVAAARRQEAAERDCLIAHCTEPNNEERERRTAMVFDERCAATCAAVRALDGAE